MSYKLIIRPVNEDRSFLMSGYMYGHRCKNTKPTKACYNICMNGKDIDCSKFIGVSLDSVKRVLAAPGQMGYEEGLHHHFLLRDAPVDVYDRNLPMGIVNISGDPKLPVVVFVCQKWFDNIETVTEQPGDKYERCILTYFEASYPDSQEDYTQ